MSGMSDDFSTAMELLLGEAPTRDQVERGVAMLEQASAAGNANASERCALFEAIGMMRPQDWPRSLSLLELAAQQGSSSAQAQLLLLSDPSSDPQVPDSVPPEFWSEARARISMDQRTDPGETLSLSEQPRIRFIKGFATPAECRCLIGIADGRVTRATVFDQATGEQTHDPARDNSYLGLRLGEMNVITEVIRNRISRATRLPVPLFEAPQLLHYSVGQQFKPHYDFLDPANPAYDDDLASLGQRIATFLIYLNDGYGGGETSFVKVGRSARPSIGDALFWANVRRDGSPDPDTLHAGLPLTSGEKWVFSQWIRDKFPGRN
jgi:hypothetical protein